MKHLIKNQNILQQKNYKNYIKNIVTKIIFILHTQEEMIIFQVLQPYKKLTDVKKIILNLLMNLKTIQVLVIVN